MSALRILFLFSIVNVITLSAARHPAEQAEASSSGVGDEVEMEMEDDRLSELRQVIRGDAFRTLALIEDGAPITRDVRDMLQEQVFRTRQVEQEIIENFGATVMDGDNWYSVRFFGQRYLDQTRQRAEAYERACELAGLVPE